VPRIPWSQRERQSTDVRRLLASAFVNSLGNGFVIPFLFVYLHDEVGLSYSVAGLVIASNGFAAILASPVVGAAIDRFGAHVVIVCALVASAVGYASFIFVDHAWQAFLAAIVAGVGTGGYWPAHGTLLATASSDAERAWGGRYQMMALGFGVGVLVAGQVAHLGNAASFHRLFVVDAMTFVACIFVIPRLPHHSREETGRGGILVVLSDRPFLFMFVLNTALIAAGISQFDVLPAYLTNEAGLTPEQVSAVFVANTVAVAALQPLVGRRASGNRRMVMISIAAAVWATVWIAVLATGTSSLSGGSAATLFVLCGFTFGIAECLFAGTMGSITADLAKPSLLGRYMAVSALSWSAGGVIGPAVGGFLLSQSATLLWLTQATVLAVASASAVLGERLLPVRVRRSPVRVATATE
jgi:MFS family permease